MLDALRRNSCPIKLCEICKFLPVFVNKKPTQHDHQRYPFKKKVGIPWRPNQHTQFSSDNGIPIVQWEC